MLARVHSFLGVAPLGAYLLFHVIQTWPVLYDRELWVERAVSGPSRGVLLAWLLVPLALHVALGVVRMRRVPDAASNGAPGLRVLQALTGAVVLVFLIYHVQQVWVTPGPHSSPRDAYAALWRELGRPFDAGLYVLGVTAVSFHLGHGLSRAAVTFELARSARAVRNARLLAGALGFTVWVLLLQLLGHFAVGEALIRFAD